MEGKFESRLLASGKPAKLTEELLIQAIDSSWESLQRQGHYREVRTRLPNGRVVGIGWEFVPLEVR